MFRLNLYFFSGSLLKLWLKSFCKEGYCNCKTNPFGRLPKIDNFPFWAIWPKSQKKSYQKGLKKSPKMTHMENYIIERLPKMSQKLFFFKNRPKAKMSVKWLIRKKLCDKCLKKENNFGQSIIFLFFKSDSIGIWFQMGIV